MAFVGNAEEEQKQKAIGSAPAMSQASGEATGGDSSAPSGGESSSGSGTGWTNLQSYLKSNEGNDGQMANKIASDTKGIMDQTRSDTADWKTDVQDKTASGTTSAFGGSGPMSQMGQDDFSKYYDAEYKGPQTAEDSSKFQAADSGAKKFQGLSTATDSFAGRQGLVNDSFKRDDYGKGMNLLDTFLVSGGKQGKETMQGIRDEYTGFESDLNKSKADLGSGIKSAQDTTAATQQGFRSQVSDEAQGYQDQIDTAKYFLDGGTGGDVWNNPLSGGTNIQGSDAFNKTRGETNSAQLKALRELEGKDTSDMTDFSAYDVAPNLDATSPVTPAAEEDDTDYLDLISRF